MKKFLEKTILTSASLAIVLATNFANAGQCPKDQVREGARTGGPTEHVKVTDVVLATVGLAEERVSLPNHSLRLRRLVVQPGGIVPWHNHSNRPAIIYIASGEIHEYRSNCLVPILHKAGETSREFNGVSHYWKNNSKNTVVLFSSDLVEKRY